MRWRFHILLLAASASLFSPGTHATTLVQLSLDELAVGADAVVRVKCGPAESRWDSGSIWTVTTLEVVETMKGALPQEISVRLPGGHVGAFTVAVDGVPRFHPGDEAVLFLSESRAGGYTVAGWVQGTFRISHDARTGAETVTQDSNAFAVFDPAARAFHSVGIRRMPIEEFRVRVAAAVARSQATELGKERPQ